ncbi:hypothetical protein MKJ01_07435 [Chryseobacterium sp. SSA4.19]|uniref:hypothetical protein n=1 Tax=Chryseobacterium sp. SSA4.19 TaxID=2919915 RepID=UPI001F4E468B|nr:hypothetical protein [Chryseobacterium sp. SSA4.19]MCJ8153595.1 hypothetical protein [Chryseobacterium sp. SSA4.19]
MKIYILSAALLMILSCKKEVYVPNIHQNDSIKAIGRTKKDSTNTLIQKEEIFNFTTELCDNKGYFDPTRYSREQLEGTYKLWFQMGGTLLSTPSVFNLDELQKIRDEKDKILAQLDKDFIHQKKVLEQLTVVDDPYWKNIKTQKQQELTDEYEFRKTEIQAFSDPSILTNHKLSKNCKSFAEALYSNGPKMIEEWKKLREEMSRKNSDPGRIISEFKEHLNSPDKNDYAIIDLITFGWGNCANDNLKKTQHDEKMYKKFNSLFIKIDSECDEP